MGSITLRPRYTLSVSLTGGVGKSALSLSESPAGEAITLAMRAVFKGDKGEQGDKGDKGATGDKGEPGGTLMTALAAQALSGHRVVLIDATGTADYASSDQPLHALRVAGVTTGAVEEGAEASIQTFGNITEPSWNWTANQPIYLGLNGALTQTAPAQPGSKFVKVIGFPITAQSMFISPQPAISIL